MGMPLRPWTVRALALIDEGVTDREELVEMLTPHVPQGHAFRHRESERLRQIERHRPVSITGRNHRPQTLHPTEIHRIGARHVIVQMLRGLVANGTLIRDGTSYRRPVREQRHCPAQTVNGHAPNLEDSP